MTVDNSEKILKMMSFNKYDFYFVQILKRRKDNPGMERDMTVLNNYYIESISDFHKKIGSIKAHCDLENARAYFRLNKRNYKDLSLKLNERVVKYIASQEFAAMKKVFDTIAGESHSDPDKKWLVDIDDVKLEDLNKSESTLKLAAYVEELQKLTGRVPLMEYVPSKNGIHLITRPFNLKKFKEVYPNVEVQKDNMIILYC